MQQIIFYVKFVSMLLQMNLVLKPAFVMAGPGDKSNLGKIIFKTNFK